jgi:hypothetical protein
MWVSGFLTVGPKEGRNFFRNVIFLVFSAFIFVVTMEKVLEEVFEHNDSFILSTSSQPIRFILLSICVILQIFHNLTVAEFSITYLAELLGKQRIFQKELC